MTTYIAAAYPPLTIAGQWRYTQSMGQQGQ